MIKNRESIIRIESSSVCHISKVTQKETNILELVGRRMPGGDVYILGMILLTRLKFMK